MSRSDRNPHRVNPVALRILAVSLLIAECGFFIDLSRDIPYLIERHSCCIQFDDKCAQSIGKFSLSIIIFVLLWFRNPTNGVYGLCASPWFPIVIEREAVLMSKVYTEILKTTSKIKDKLIDIRRDLHQYPETAGNEYRTSHIIEEYLLSLGLEVISGVGGYGVVGVLRGDKPGKVIAWRADIDALETDFPDLVDFRSKNNGMRHICGHDVHTVIGLGIAEVLCSHKKEMEGTVIFIFQPAEENLTGAANMLDERILEKLKPEAIFALHLVHLPTGIIAVKAGEMMSVKKKIRILLTNQGDMNAIERECKSLLEHISNVSDVDCFLNINTLVDFKLGINSPDSIYKNYIVMVEDVMINHSQSEISIEGNFYSSSEKNLITALEGLREDLSKKEWKGCIKSVAFSQEMPIVYNNQVITEIASNIIQSISAGNPIIPLYGVVPQFNDDFAVFQESVPGVYFFFGGSDFTKGIISAPHTPNFTVDEKCIEIGVCIFSSMLLEYLRYKLNGGIK